MNMSLFNKINNRISRLESRFNTMLAQFVRSEVTGGVVPIAYADLPTPNTSGGRMYYVTDGRKSGEGAGNGTGVYVGETDLSGVATWVRLDDQTQEVTV